MGGLFYCLKHRLILFQRCKGAMLLTESVHSFYCSRKAQNTQNRSPLIFSPLTFHVSLCLTEITKPVSVETHVAFTGILTQGL